MSVEATNWARRTTVGNPTAKAVLCAIANYADAAGSSWPSQAMLCIDTELSERAVRNAIQLLKDRGLLTSKERRRTNGSRRSDLLILSMAVDANRSDVPVGQSGQAANRHDVPVGGNQPAPDAGWVDGGATNRHDMPEGAIQPAPDAGSPTGTSCRTNRHVVPDQPARGAGLTSFEPPLNHQRNHQEVREHAPPPPPVEAVPQIGGAGNRPAKPTSPKADRGHRIPDDWRLSEADRRFARDAGWTEPQIADAEAEFVDHWSNVPGKDGLKLDWSKAWRNRVRRFGAPGTSRNHSRNRSPEKSGVTDLLRDFEERIHERDNPGASGRGRTGSGAWPHDRSLNGRDRDGGAGPILDLEPIRSHDG